jgi:hypothetical protein
MKPNQLTLQPDTTYLNSRLSALGVTEDQNIFTLSNGEATPIFSADEQGNIVIHYINLQGNVYSWKKAGTKYPRPFTRTRFKRPDGNHKYDQDKGSPAFPFFNPRIIEKFRNQEKINTLILVEGEFKSFVGCLKGLDIIGIPSNRPPGTPILKGKIHEDIELLITTCSVKQIVLLLDADTTSVDWKEGKDMHIRPSSFFSAIKLFRESLHLLLGNPLELIVFSHILPKFEDGGKGLDDLLSKYTSVVNEIIQDLNKFHLATDYFRGFLLNDINTDLKKLSKYLGLYSPGEFFETHKEHIGDNQFVYRGKLYHWNSQTTSLDELKNEVPYIRVATQFYKITHTPQANGETLIGLAKWTRSCIEMDHGKDYIKRVEIFEGWCWVPDHVNFQPSVAGYYNRYYPLKYLPQQGNCDSSLDFVKHIFGEQYELGLDYLQLLYTRPTQILPVVCLISEERNTGKTTFLNWLVSIFGGNATINRNEDLETNFNSSWAGKLIVAVDESFIDRKKIYERIKALSTGKTMKVEAKGQDSVDAEFFGKLILCSNNVDSFIPVDSSEIRFWIRKIEPFKKENPHLLSNFLIAEIPAFLQFLLDRKISTEQKTRMWFTQADIQTNALSNIVSKNKSYLEKELTALIVEILLDCDLSEVKFTFNDMAVMLAKSGVREPQFKLKELVVNKWKLDCHNSTYTKWIYNDSGDRNYFQAKGKHYTFTRDLFGLPKRDIDSTSTN